MAVLCNNVIAGASIADDAAGGGDAYQIEKSIRFGGNSYISKTFGEGNRRKWTWAGWVKRSAFDQYHYFFTSRSANTNYFQITFTDQAIKWYNRPTSGTHRTATTTALFRDPSAWYHIVLNWDTAQATDSDRVRLYVNGERITSFTSTTWPDQYEESVCNDNHHHEIGAYNSGTNYPHEGYLADTQFIDGLALSPGAFGSFDSTGNWNPKAFAIPKPNNGTTWSSTVTTGGASLHTSTFAPDSGKATNLFNSDGIDYGTFTNGPDNSTAIVTWKPPSDITADCSIRIGLKKLEYVAGATFTINGVDLVNDLFTQTGVAMDGTSATSKWYTAPSRTITAADGITWGKYSTDKEIIVSAIEVDGVLLRDGITDVATRNNLNDGTTWSSYWSATTGTVDGTHGFTNSFDGSVATRTNASNDSILKWIPPTTITAKKGIELYMYLKGTQQGENDFKVNNVSKWTDAHDTLGDYQTGWYEIGKTIDATNGIQIGQDSSNDHTCYIYAMRIDGHILVDSTVDNSFHLKFNDTSLNRYLGKDTLNGKIEDATGGLPILKTKAGTNDNDIDYGDVKDTGTRADSDSANLLLAVPFDTTTPTDYHATIKGSGTNRTLTTSTSNVAYAATTDSRFYGSAANMATGTGGGTNVSGVTTTTDTDDFEVGTGDFTLEFWAKWDPETTTNSYIFSLEKTAGASPYPLYIFRTSSGTIKNWNNDFDLEQFSDVGSDGAWHHYALVRHNSGKTFTGYIDGRKDTEIVRASAYDMPANVDKVSIGHYSNSYNVNGLLQEVRFYNKAKYSGNFKTPARNDFTVNNLIASTADPGFEFGHNYDNYTFDQNSTSVTYDVTGANIDSWSDMTSPKVIDPGDPGGAENQNSLRVYRTKDGSKRVWTITLNHDSGGSESAYVYTSNDGVNWVSPSGVQDCSSGYSTPAAAYMTHAGGAFNDASTAWTATGDPANLDSLVDTPTNYGEDTGAGGEVRGNYCTWNPLDISGGSLTQGNLTYAGDGGGGTFDTVKGTFALTGGKYYWETPITGATMTYLHVGIMKADMQPVEGGSDAIGQSQYPGSVAMVCGVGDIKENSNVRHNGDAIVTGDVLNHAFDSSTGKYWIGVNGTWRGATLAEVNSGTNPAHTCETTDTYVPAISEASTQTSVDGANFGQRAWKYPDSVPTDYKALCTQNLDDTFSGDELNNPSKYFDVTTWVGDDSSPRTITQANGDFTPDLIWLKNRTTAGRSHYLYDAVRTFASQKELVANSDDEEGSSNHLTQNHGYVSGVGAGTFTLGAGATNQEYTNKDGDNFVAWNWDAGTAAATPSTDGSMTLSGQWVNATAGFSITTYTGTEGGSFGHALGAKPDLVWVKKLNASADWCGWHSGIASTKYLVLNANSAASTFNVWGDTDPTNTIVTVSGDNYTGNNGDNYLAYCWTAIPGYSAFGSYGGNSSTNGSFIYTGFNVKYVLIKRIDSTSPWTIFDSARSYNENNHVLEANATSAEDTPANRQVDLLSNGFKNRATSSNTNTTGGTYIYAAFAEHPFKTARAR